MRSEVGFHRYLQKFDRASGLEHFATASEKKLNGLKGDAQAVDALLAQAHEYYKMFGM